MQGRTQKIGTLQDEAAPGTLVPRHLGKYQILETIGEGGFGIVYRGFDPFIKRHVAIKTCSSPDPELRLRYFREAEIAGRLDHPNIVRIFDFGTQDDTPFLVQEFLAGVDLDEKMARHEFIPFPERLLYLIHIARGLAFAHAHEVIHRDIKPANIRILDDGTAKIMDFGVAMLLDADTRLTRDGMAVGTAAYLAPEQVQGRSPTPRTDIFSFGVLAYELLTGQRPFERDTISATLYAVLHDDPKPINLPEHACPVALRQLIERCLRKDPAERWASGNEIVDALDHIRRERRAGPVSRDLESELREVAPQAEPADSSPAAMPEDRIMESRLEHGWAPPAIRMRRRRRWLPAFLVAATLVALAVAWILVSGTARLPWPMPPMTPDSADLAADLAADPGPPESELDTDGPDLFVEKNLSAGGSLSTPSDGPSRTANDPSPALEPAPTKAQTSAAVEVPAPPPIEKATLVLTAGWHEGMTASIDGGETMTLGRSRSRQLEPGPHSVRFALVTSDYKDSRNVRIDLSPGEERALRSPLLRPGLLSVQANLGSPQGIVRLGGQPLGLSPIRSLHLPPGNHRLQVFAIDHPTTPLADRNVEIQSDRETVITFDLTGQRELAVRHRPTSGTGTSP